MNAQIGKVESRKSKCPVSPNQELAPKGIGREILYSRFIRVFPEEPKEVPQEILLHKVLSVSAGYR
jgi:hypothetical protein